MKTNLKISLVAGLLLAAGLAYSQSPMGGAQCDMMGGMHGQSMGHRGMGKMDPAKMQAMMDKRHADLKTQLKITPAQEAAWTTFMAAHQAPAGMMGKQAPAMADFAKLTTPERMDKMKELHAQRMSEMTVEMDKRAAATKTFYAVLSPEQQKILDAQTMMGPGGRHGASKGMGRMPPSQ